ncbi:MerR family transcriptional regulator [Georgenia faecalis]|uniref:MerR family transcriptional regulator n=1 Tax=Georgenia faecalis TaxID=2483799 RepID=A0ABV9D8G6_9MICO|nr:MerR family transcriptional regulator [Georgenia faecalis]
MARRGPGAPERRPAPRRPHGPARGAVPRHALTKGARRPTDRTADGLPRPHWAHGCHDDRRLSRATKLTAKALRFYHETGLLTPSSVDPHSGYRRYGSEQVAEPQVIRALRALDVPVDVAREVLAAPDVASRGARPVAPRADGATARRHRVRRRPAAEPAR